KVGMDMINFIIRRMLQLVIVIFGVTVIVFSLMHLIPGNPATIIAGEGASSETIALVEERLGLHDPIIVQYFNFLLNAVHLDFGSSWKTNLPVICELRAIILFKLTYN